MPYFKLFDTEGRRNFLNTEERKRFELATRLFPAEIRTICLVLLYTGSRLTEAMNLKTEDIRFREKVVKIESIMLKKRSGVSRFVPLSDNLLDELNLVHNLQTGIRNKDRKIWNWTPRTTLNYIHDIMDKAQINGLQTNARGLRHSFGIFCAKKQIPITIIQKWMGHANIDAALAYQNAVKFSERDLASTLWNGV